MINIKTNNLLKSRLAFILVFAVAFIFSLNLAPSKALAADTATARKINITGDGEVSVTPDMANLFLGVSMDKSTTAEAQAACSVTINNIIDAIKTAGLKDEDIKTTSYSIYPKYEYDKTTGRSSLVGYTVSTNLNVTVKDISKVGQIIDTAVDKGANISNGINFGISDYEKYYNMALVDALSNAQNKAQAISNSLGIKLTTPVEITENSDGVANDYPVSINSKLQANAALDSTSIEAGTFKVKANIGLVYEY